MLWPPSASQADEAQAEPIYFSFADFEDDGGGGGGAAIEHFFILQSGSLFSRISESGSAGQILQSGH